MFPASWRKPKPTKLPLGLSGPEVKAIQSLAGSPEWPVFRKALEELYRLKGRELLLGCDELHYHHGLGFLRAIEQIATLPDTLTNANARVQTDARRTEPIGDPFYGSPHWTGYSPNRVSGPNGRPSGVGAG